MMRQFDFDTEFPGVLVGGVLVRVVGEARPLQRPPVIVTVSNKRKLQIGASELEYTLLRSARRSIGFLINDEGLRVTAPKWLGIAEIENSIRDKQGWIFTKLHERRERTQRRPQTPAVFGDGVVLPYLGRDLSLQLSTQSHANIVHDADMNKLLVSTPPATSEQALKQLVQHWLQAQARNLFSQRLPVYAQRLGVKYHSFALSSAATRWGSCTSEGKIRLNWRLVHFAPPLIDYVIAHELAHLREMNHSPRFWATVGSVYPDYEAARKTLRKHAQEIPALF